MSTSIPDTGEWGPPIPSPLSGRIYDSPVDLMVDRMGDLWVAGLTASSATPAWSGFLGSPRSRWTWEGNATPAGNCRPARRLAGHHGPAVPGRGTPNAPGQRLAVDRRPFTLYPADGLALSL
ncbi:MAG: hypothetical protein RMK65_09080, partial [Anaerolineae bacterium]|nr:hypothetical protein [Anaerolineae bacterium]